MPNLFAGDIKTDPNLMNTLGGISTGPKNSLNDVYSRIKSRFGKGNVVSGRPTSDYNAERMATSQSQGERGIDNSLLGVLGDTTYKDALAERDYQQNMELAKRIGALNAPSILQQVLNGLGGGAQAGGQFYGLYNALGKGASGSSGTPSFGLSRSSNYGLDYPGTPDFGYGQQYPNELRIR